MTRSPIPELDDLDRYEGQVITDADYTRMVQQFDALVYARVLAERAAQQAVWNAYTSRMARRRVWQRVAKWGAIYVVASLLYLYLRSIGE